MITFTTESGSVYELDTPRKAIRRLTGKNDPTPRQGPDGQWKVFHEATTLAVGHRLGVVWSIDGEDGVVTFRTTFTSAVESISDSHD